MTKTLVVGQGVFIHNVSRNGWGKVVEITPTNVIVQCEYVSPPPDGAGPNYRIRFNKDGVACESQDIDEYKGWFWGDSKIPGTKHGPYTLAPCPRLPD